MIINEIKTQVSTGLNKKGSDETLAEQEFYQNYLERKYSFKKFLIYMVFITLLTILNTFLNYSNIILYEENNPTSLISNNIDKVSTDNSHLYPKADTSKNTTLSSTIIQNPCMQEIDIENLRKIFNLNIIMIITDFIVIFIFVLTKKFFVKKIIYVFIVVSFFISFSNLVQFQILRSSIQNKLGEFHNRYTLPNLYNSIIFYYLIYFDSNWILNSISYLIGSIVIYFVSIGYRWTDGVEGMILILASIINGYFAYLLTKKERGIYQVLQNSKNYMNNMENLLNSFNSSSLVIKPDLSVTLDKKSKKLLSDIYFESDDRNLIQLAKIFLFSEVIELGDNFKNKDLYVQKIMMNTLFHDLKLKLMAYDNENNFEEKDKFLVNCEKEAKILLEDLIKNFENTSFEYFSLIKIKISKFSKDKYLRVFVKRKKTSSNSSSINNYSNIISLNSNSSCNNVISSKNINNAISTYNPNLKNLSLEFLINDITSIVNIDEINSYSKERSIFLLKLSHEIRSPLTNILDLLDNIKNSLKTNFQQTNNELVLLVNNIKHVKNFCKFMSSVIDDFEFFSNPKTGKDKNEKLEIEEFIKNDNFVNINTNAEIKIKDNKEVENEIIDIKNNAQTKINMQKNDELNKSQNININTINNLMEKSQEYYGEVENRASNYNINVYDINNVLNQDYTSNINIENELKKANVNNKNGKNDQNEEKYLNSKAPSNRSKASNHKENQNNIANNIINNQQGFLIKFPNFSNFNLRKLIISTIKIFDTKILLSNKNVTLSILINPNVPENIVSDYLKLKQILFNTVSNSFKFTNSGLISVIVLKKNNFLEFTISDTGIGIQREFIPYIFDAYFKCEGNPNNQYGAGIGLFIVKNFIEEMGGQINVDSEFNNGTTIYFSIPFYIQQDTNDYFIKLSLEPSESEIFLEQSTIIKKSNNQFDDVKSEKPLRRRKKYYSTANVLKDGFLKSPKLKPLTSRLCYTNRKNIRPGEDQNLDYIETTRRIDENQIISKIGTIIKGELEGEVEKTNNKNSQKNLLLQKKMSKSDIGCRNVSIKDIKSIIEEHNQNQFLDDKSLLTRQRVKIQALNNSKDINKDNNEFNNFDEDFYKDDQKYEKVVAQDNTLILDESRDNLNKYYKNVGGNDKAYNLYINDSPSIFQSSNLFEKTNRLSPITCRRKIATPMSISKYTTTNINSKKNKEKFKKFRILIVDDESLIRQSTKKMLKKFFFNTFENLEIIECEDGFDCLYKIYLGLKERIRYDLIITDETMSFMSGTIMASIIRTLTIDNVLYRLPIYLLTSYSTNLYDENSEKIFNGIFPKPINLEILGSIIQSLCKLV